MDRACGGITRGFIMFAHGSLPVLHKVSAFTIHFMAFSKEAVAKPVFQPCRHGPFCDRCRAAVGRCILPACVCRALLECWREDATDSVKSAAVHGMFLAI